MTMTIEDTALVMDIIARPHRLDPFSLLPAEADHEPQEMYYSKELKLGVKGLKIAVSLSLDGFVPNVHPEIIRAVKDAAQIFTSLGATVAFVEPPLSQYDMYKAFKTLWCTGAANRLQALVENVAAANTSVAQQMEQSFDKGLQKVAQMGHKMTAVNVSQAEYIRANMAQAMNLFHEQYDLLITPTEPIPPFHGKYEVPPHEWFTTLPVAGSKSPAFEDSDRERWWTWTPFT